MTDYDDLFADTAPDDSVFVDKGVLDPLAEPESIHARESQERELATVLNGVHDGYLPPTVSVYGPPGTGKTLTTRRVCHEFAERHEQVAVEYVNLKECRTLFRAANEILYELTGERKKAYQGLDGVFAGIWAALADYPAWTVLLLDEIDHIRRDTNYDPNEFFYRLLRGEGKLKRDISLSIWLLSNELLEVDLRLDSRVESAMSDEQVFFPPYGIDDLRAVVGPRLERAFHEGAVPEEVRAYGVQEAARRWGDARKALTLFRQAGETATKRKFDRMTRECVDANLETTEREATVEKLLSLPFNHFFVLTGVVSWTENSEIKQPVTTAEVHEALSREWVPDQICLGQRAVRDVITDLETMGLVETWIDSRGAEGRIKRIETTFEPEWIPETIEQYATESTYFTKLDPV